MASPAALSVMDTPFCQAVSSELASPSSLLVKDASKRKRVNRNAKLKQCKLDARREQWLSQVAMIKPGKEGHQEPSSSSKLELGEIVHPDNDESFTYELQRYSSENFDRVLSRPHLHIPRPENCGIEDMNDTSSPSASGSCVSNCSESEYSPKSPGTASPKGKVKRVGKDHQQGRFVGDFEGNKVKDGITGNAKSVGSNAVGAHKVEDLDTEPENDDWEAAADALDLNCFQEAVCSAGQVNTVVEEKDNLDLPHHNSAASSKPITSSNLAAPREVMSRSVSGRAWRPDDASRPASLPNLNKQQSLPARFVGQKHWVYTPKALQDPLSGPSLCPICAEELDSTDSSFEPCVCGFQLCLFCHHRIVSDDGRCPGCRRFYNSLLAASPATAPGLC